MRSALVGFSLLSASYYYNRKGPVIYDNLTTLTIHRGVLIIFTLQPKSQRGVIDIDFIIGYSAVKIERVSDIYSFYYNYRKIEQWKLHHLLLYIKCVSVVWEHVVSAHGADTALNRESPGIYFCLFLFILILCISVHEKINIFLFGSTLCQIRNQIQP